MNTFTHNGEWIKISSQPSTYMNRMGGKIVLLNLDHAIINGDDFYGKKNIYYAMEALNRKMFPRNDFE